MQRTRPCFPKTSRSTGRAKHRDQLTILHFAFEDHRAPGSGGGGARTHEINKRLASHHRVITVTYRYPGARRRVEDGVEYRHLGVSFGRFAHAIGIVSYHLLAPLYAFTHRADLVVEDFAAPMSSLSLPRFTRHPTVAVVQWLFASEVGKKYHLPLSLFERAGVLSHRHFITVSEFLADRIKAGNPSAEVRVAHGGITLQTTEQQSSDRKDLLYLGRMQYHEKGLGLLLEAFSEIAQHDRETKLLLAGTGPDMGLVAKKALDLGISSRVHQLGRIEGEEKTALLREAALLVMPSRFESFGLVAAEALAEGLPVLAYDIPAMREVVRDDCGVLVEPFDVHAFALACEQLLADPQRRADLGEAGRKRSELFDWDRAARIHEELYQLATRDNLDGALSSRGADLARAASPAMTASQGL